MIRLLVALSLILFALPAAAQDAAEEERSMFLAFVENQLSGPNRDIRISNVEGILSSNATIGEITVADREGVWMRIVNASIVWSRGALLLRQRLEIESLSAERIDVVRQPIPADGLPAPEAATFAVPDLPLGIQLDSLEVPLARFGPTVFGLESELSLQGRLLLEDGALDTALRIERLDGPGGQLSLDATYSNVTEILELDLALSEPEDGVVANLLNIQDRPPIDLTVSGAGPLSELDIELTLDAADDRVLSGVAQLRQQAEGLGFQTRLGGPIAVLVPPQFRPFFGEETALEAAGLLPDEGGVRLDRLELQSAALALQASAETEPDGFLSRLRLDAVIDDGTEVPVVLPVPGAATTVDRAHLTLDYGNGPGEEWTGLLEIESLITPEFVAENARLQLSGLASNIESPELRRVTYALQGALSGVRTPDPGIEEALGDRVTLTATGEWNADEPLLIDEARVSAEALDIFLTGAFEDFAFLGELGVETANIAPFSGLAGRPVSGALDLRASGEVWPISGAFALVLDGRIEELRVAEPAIDNLMDGQTRITGLLSRTEEGLSTEDFRVANEQMELTANGTFATGAADFGFDFTLEDLALVSPRASGQLTASGRAEGSDGLIGLEASIRVPSGTLADRRLADATLGFDGQLQDGDLTGFLAGSAFLDGERAELATAIEITGQQRRFSDIRLTAGGALLTGSLTQGPTGLFDGRLDVDAADISTVAAFFLVEATGSVEAELLLSPEEGQQALSVTANLADFTMDGVRIGRAELAAEIEDLFGVPAIEGSLSAVDALVAGVVIETLRLDAARDGDATTFQASAELAGNVTASAAGSLAPEADGYRVGLDSARIGRGLVAATLVEPASLLVVGDTVTLDSLVLNVAGGRVAARGEIAETLDLNVDIEEVPLVIANLVRPDLGLDGTIDGSLQVTGPRDAPDVAFNLIGTNVAAEPLREMGLSRLSLQASGTTANGRLNVEAAATSPEGLRATASGTVPLPEGQLALDVELAAFPLAIVQPLAPDLALSGTLTGTARVTGTLDDPAATFNISGTGIGAAPLRELGIGAVNVSATGRYADEIVTLTAANVEGPLGLSFSANGTLPLTGTGANLSFSGSVPLALANRFVADRGTQLAGTLQIQGTLSGSLANPAISANLSTANAQILDPLTNFALRGVTLAATLQNDTVTISSLTGTIAAGGTLNASGTVSINATAGLPANLQIVFSQARVIGDFFVATASGNLSITGPLLRDPLIAGRIDVDRAEVSVPENLGGGAAAIDVIHRAPPPGVRATLERARAPDGTPVPVARPNVPRLDVTIAAPNRIFLRGRGLDAELGGTVRLTGPLANVQPVGGFELIRGRLSILGQRITFDEGTVTLVGDLDPFVHLIARTTGQDITVIITVTGRVSDLDIQFSSQPELPEDEVLARLIFNRGLGELSPLQIAQLATAALELAGGGDSTLLGTLRGATGLDDIDIVTDDEGGAAVRAGRYIQDNVYLGVEAGARGGARATINLDITDEIRARGAVGTDGESSLGIFFERDY